MKFTEHFKLSSVEAGEPILPLEDSRRFLTIDRQLLGLFEVFGNGVIEGWNVVSGNGLSVNVTTGRGHVNFMAAATTIARTVPDLLPNSTNYIYAQAIDETKFNRNVLFFAETTLFNSGDQILLAKVTTDANGVAEIDATVRNDISFIETIKTLINQHRHRGGDDNPSKIDLQSEVIGQLPGFRIEQIPASKVTSGRFDPARIPALAHGDLLNSGVLTHAQLDSFVRNLSNENVRLLGELSAANLLQSYLAMKHIWNEVDRFAFNLITLIPGITPDSFSDLPNTTALFDRSQHLIQGIPSLPGSLLTTTLSTQADFEQNNAIVNLDIKSENGTDFFQLTRPFIELLVEGFDNVFSDEATYSDWTLETVQSNSTTKFQSDSAKKADGAFSAEWDVDQSFRIQVTKTFDSNQDWSEFNELEISVETLSTQHGQIRLELLKGTGSQETAVADFLLVNTNEITSGFQRIVLDILPVDRSQIRSIRVYADSSLGWDLSPFVVNIDTIKLNNNLFFKESGSIRFRFETPQKSSWAAIAWDADLNGGTVLARARSAPNFAVLDQTDSVPFSSFFAESGGDPGIDDNTNIEFELALTAASGNTATPVVRSITLSFITNNVSTGLTIDTTSEFLRATSQKNTRVETVDVATDDGQVIIDGRIDVGDVPYGNLRSIQQVDRFNTPVVGITGSSLPLSPIQALSTNTILRQPSLNGVTTVIRNQDKSYLITDTLNDRVLLLDRQGRVLKGLASNNARSDSETLYPLTASYNREDSILYVSWTTNVKFSSVDLSQFTINGSGIVLRLSNSIDSVTQVQGRNSDLDSGNVTAILLGTAHAAELELFFNSQSTTDPRLFLDIEPEAVESGVNLDNKNFATLSTARGLPVFVGPIKFIRGLHRPISVSTTSSGNWLIGNAKPIVTGSATGQTTTTTTESTSTSSDEGVDPITGVGKSEITSVIEVVPDTGEIVFSDDSVDFSLVTFGGAVEVNERYVTVAGIVPDENIPDTAITETTTIATLGLGNVTVTATTSQPVTSQDTTGTTTTTQVTSDLDALSQYRGIIKTVEKKSGRVVFEELTSDGTFATDVQLDLDGNLVVVEKSFNGLEGRGRVVKIDDCGNVYFAFGFKDLSSPNDVRVLSTGNLVISS